MNCDDPTAILSSMQMTYPTGPSPPYRVTDGASWTIICQIGYYYGDGSNSKVIKCGYLGKWFDIPSIPCIGINHC